jgi:hypothetical protein
MKKYSIIVNGKVVESTNSKGKAILYASQHGGIIRKVYIQGKDK